MLQDVRALIGRGHTVGLLYGHDGPQRTDYENAGASVSGPHPFAFDFRRPLRSLGSFQPAIAAARALRPHVLWLNRPENIGWAQAISRFARIPVVCHLHHAPNFNRLTMLYTGIRQFVSVSEFTKSQWVARGLPPERVAVLPNAIPPTAYPFGGLEERGSTREVLRLPASAPVVLFYGRLSEEKGIFTLFDAWRRLAERRPDAVLVLVGGPDPREDPALAHALDKLPGETRWFPFQSDMVPFLHACDVVVVPSHVAEAFGRVVIETLATGRPVIASRVGGIPEVLTGPLARFLFTPGDADSLLERLEPLLRWRTTDPGLAREGAAWVSERFSYTSHIDRLEEILMQNARSRPDRELRRAVHGAYV